METQIERRRRTLTAEDIAALVDAMETRAMDRIQKTVGRTMLNFAVTWVVRLVFAAALYSAGASGVLRRIFAA
ncbi:hypothetical protein [Burkholderia pseudomallei]|uniref:hypothetical protein n=1 Tax=Burkholderia pseudomallei TaxID=28450 RepID=UPI000A1A216A|nr:hypothetical protein [Burkholderia pseudomallei]ARL25504.1 hypothetical protein BOC47_24345 [Burkholderia pseudomallei]ARL84225.1 hypothetical protein BOC55_35440 [Burkholderia pseudomallei]